MDMMTHDRAALALDWNVREAKRPGINARDRARREANAADLRKRFGLV